MATIAFLGYAPASPLRVVLPGSPAGSWPASSNPARAVGPYPQALGTGNRVLWPYVAGTFTDVNGQPGERLIHVYARSTGRLIAFGYSNASTGAYRIDLPPGTGEVKVTCQDDAAGTLRPDLVLRTLPVGP